MFHVDYFGRNFELVDLALKDFACQEKRFS